MALPPKTPECHPRANSRHPRAGGDLFKQVQTCFSLKSLLRGRIYTLLYRPLVRRLGLRTSGSSLALANTARLRSAAFGSQQSLRSSVRFVNPPPLRKETREGRRTKTVYRGNVPMRVLRKPRDDLSLRPSRTAGTH